MGDGGLVMCEWCESARVNLCRVSAHVCRRVCVCACMHVCLCLPCTLTEGGSEEDRVEGLELQLLHVAAVQHLQQRLGQGGVLHR